MKTAPATIKRQCKMLISWIAPLTITALFLSCGLWKGEQGGVIPAKLPEGIPVENAVLKDKGNNEKTDLRPFLKNDGSKFTLAVVDSDGLWPPYVEVFAGIIEGLQTIGWINEETLLPNPSEVTIQEYLARLNEQDYSDYLTLKEEHYIDLEWDETKVKDPFFVELFSPESPADLVLCMGTLAGKLISDLEKIPVPVIADSISDPISSGIILSNEDSGKDNLTVRVDPLRYNRQIRLFYDVVQFKRLGMIYEDTQDGRAYAALDDVTSVSQEKGFTIISNTDVLGDQAETDEEAETAYLDAVREIAPRVDAIYLTEQKGLSSANISEVMGILEEHKVLSFSMTGAEMVSQGVLFGVSDSERISSGIYHAKNIIRIFHGEKPRNLNQIFEHIPHIAVNLGAAEAIGYNVPISIISSSDEIYLKKSED